MIDTGNLSMLHMTFLINLFNDFTSQTTQLVLLVALSLAFILQMSSDGQSKSFWLRYMFVFSTLGFAGSVLSAYVFHVPGVVHSTPPPGCSTVPAMLSSANGTTVKEIDALTCQFQTSVWNMGNTVWQYAVTLFKVLAVVEFTWITIQLAVFSGGANQYYAENPFEPIVKFLFMTSIWYGIFLYSPLITQDIFNFFQNIGTIIANIDTTRNVAMSSGANGGVTATDFKMAMDPGSFLVDGIHVAAGFLQAIPKASVFSWTTFTPDNLVDLLLGIIGAIITLFAFAKMTLSLVLTLVKGSVIQVFGTLSLGLTSFSLFKDHTGAYVRRAIGLGAQLMAIYLIGGLFMASIPFVLNTLGENGQNPHSVSPTATTLKNFLASHSECASSENLPYFPSGTPVAVEPWHANDNSNCGNQYGTFLTNGGSYGTTPYSKTDALLAVILYFIILENLVSKFPAWLGEIFGGGAEGGSLGTFGSVAGGAAKAAGGAAMMAGGAAMAAAGASGIKSSLSGISGQLAMMTSSASKGSGAKSGGAGGDMAGGVGFSSGGEAGAGGGSDAGSGAGSGPGSGGDAPTKLPASGTGNSTTGRTPPGTKMAKKGGGGGRKASRR